MIRLIIFLSFGILVFLIVPTAFSQNHSTARAKNNAKQEPTKTFKTFLKLVRSNELKKATKLTDPKSAVPRQLSDFQEIGDLNKLKIVKVYACNEAALAVTTTVRDRKVPNGVLVLTAKVKDKKWLIYDIDHESVKGLDEEIRRFMKANPKAKLLLDIDSSRTPTD